MGPAISVTTPVYNGEAYLRRCWETLRRQTVADWEWILVDDGSTDDTARLAGEIAPSDPRVRLFRLAGHAGCGRARTRALEAARADWIAVWDADDLYFPWRLERALDARRQGYDFFCSYVVVADPDLRILGVRGFQRPFRTDRILTFTHPSLACRTDLAREIGYCPGLRSVGQVGEDKRLILTLASRHRGLYHRAPLLIHQPSRNYLHRSIDGNRVGLQAVRALYRDRVLPLSPAAYLRAQAATGLKLGALNTLRVCPRLYPVFMRRRLLGPPARGYRLDDREAAFIEECLAAHAPERGSPSAS